jgi:acyl-CoA reductase-like NAD-dependent aldehyde dehydrogenase
VKFEEGGAMTIQSVNPATGVLEIFPETPQREVERILEAAYTAFLDWRAQPLSQRATRMQETARVLWARKTEYARTIALEMGKPVAQGEAEVEKCAWTCEYTGRSDCAGRSGTGGPGILLSAVGARRGGEGDARL